MTPLSHATTALTNRKLRLEWEGPRPERLENKVLLPAVWKTLRECWPEPPGTSQDERITLRLVSASGTGCSLAWEAVFDFDFASSMDKTQTRSGELDVRY
jgi:hypothetical protein